MMYSTNLLPIVLGFIGIVWANDDFRTLDSIRQEYPCTSHGGLCTIAADCPKGSLVEEGGLCPLQRSFGVECCYGISVKETRCRKRGGSCLSGQEPCNKNVQFKNSTDCPKGTTCCILVN